MATEDDDTQASRKRFWAEQLRRVSETDITEFKSQQLPLARIKRIMKADEDVRMISAEAPVIFAKACELFILDLTMRAWEHTKTTKRRTLQKCDVASAIEEDDMFDFLVDIVPREAPVVMPAGMSNAEYFRYQQQAQAQALQNAVLQQQQQQQLQFQTPSDAMAAAASADYVQQQASLFANSFPSAAVSSSSSSSSSAAATAAPVATASSSSSSSNSSSSLTPATTAIANESAAHTSTSSSSLAGSAPPPHAGSTSASSLVSDTEATSRSPVVDGDVRMHDAKFTPTDEDSTRT